MPKTFFIMNDRADSSKGYTQVSEDYIKGYIDGFKNGRPYFINLGYAVMETDKEHYCSFYKDYRRHRYLAEEAAKFGVLSYDTLDNEEFSGSDIVVDTSERFEDVIDRKLIAQRLPELIFKLNETEREFVLDIYFRNISERELSKKFLVSHTAIQKRHRTIIKKLKKYF